MIAGIIGLPNVGKSALFNLLTSNAVPSSAYPYCTVEPNEGVALLKDLRMDRLADVFPGAEVVYPSIKFVDVAGLPPGASKGEGLGNKFLSHIRDADVLVHVVRAFEDERVSRFEDSGVNPFFDLELVNTELFLADLEIACRRLKDEPQSKYWNLASMKLQQQKNPPPDPDGVLLTPRPQIVLANINTGCPLPELEASRVIYMDVKYQGELANIDQQERKDFLGDIPISESNLEDILSEVKKLLGLVTFFTVVGGNKIKGYNVPEGTPVKKAAGKVHTDMEKGFIRARVYGFGDLEKCFFDIDKLKKNGKVRTEGKEYPVNDGDIIEILFS